MWYNKKNARQRAALLIGVSVLFVCAVALAVYRAFVAAPSLSRAEVFLGPAATRFSVEVAQTPRARRQGLMGRTELCSRCGMLFVFPTRGQHVFWMKDTSLALDILWIDNGRVVDLVTNTTPFSTAALVPRADARYALELPAGTAARESIRVGAPVRISMPRQ